MRIEVTVVVSVKGVLMALDSLAPFSTALPWDNIGLLVGDENAEVSACVIALDCTTDVIDYAIKTASNLIITHHPVIFEPIKSVLSEDVCFKLIKSNINVISAHTNLDLAQDGVNKALADRLGLLERRPFVNDDMVGVVGKLQRPYSADEFADALKLSLGVSSVCYVDDKKEISTVAVVGGAGDDFLFDSKIADAYVTGEVRHHCYCYAQNQGIQLFTVGHFHSEVVALEPLKDFLSKKLSVDFNVYSISPFKVR